MKQITLTARQIELVVEALEDFEQSIDMSFDRPANQSTYWQERLADDLGEVQELLEEFRSE